MYVFVCSRLLTVTLGRLFLSWRLALGTRSTNKLGRRSMRQSYAAAKRMRVYRSRSLRIANTQILVFNLHPLLAADGSATANVTGLPCTLKHVMTPCMCSVAFCAFYRCLWANSVFHLALFRFVFNLQFSHSVAVSCGLTEPSRVPVCFLRNRAVLHRYQFNLRECVCTCVSAWLTCVLCLSPDLIADRTRFVFVSSDEPFQPKCDLS